MIMIGAENTETEITGWRDINPLINPDETQSVLRPSSILSVGDICQGNLQTKRRNDSKESGKSIKTK